MSLFSLPSLPTAAHRRFGGSQRARRQRQSPRKPSFAPQPETLETRTLLSGKGYVFSTLDDPHAGTTGSSYGVQGTFTLGLNSSGEISGNYGDANYVTHGLLMNHGQYTSFDDPNAGTVANLNTGFFPGTDAVDVNNRGQVVGFYIDANNVEHSFLLSQGKYTTINDPNAGTGAGEGTLAFAINDSGQIAGWYVDSAGATHGFALRHGQYTTLDDPNGTGATFAEGINDRGQIVGFDFDATGLAHGFLATPAHRK